MTDELDFNALTEGEQRAIAERLKRLEDSGWKPFWCPDPKCDGMPHQLRSPTGARLWVDQSEMSGPKGEPVGNVQEFPETDGSVTRLRPLLDSKWAHNHARVDQRLPTWTEPWTLFIMSGRGAGKTRTGVEFVTLCARKGLDGAIVGRRGIELVNTHVAEILAHAHPEFVPEHLASKALLVWPNGAKTFLFSAETPENIRSVNLSYFWFDEAAWMDEIEAAWDNAKFAARVKSPGNPIHFLITSTPTGGKWVQEKEDDPDVIIRRVSTYANAANLDDDFLADLRKKHEGTRKGRQEIHGEVLRDVEGALWNDDMFSHLDADAGLFAQMVDLMDDRTLAVDPAGSKAKRADETGIVGVGAMHFDENDEPLPVSKVFVLGDATIKGTPTEWARQVFTAARLWRVNRIIAEKNYGGDMVKQVLMDHAKLNPSESKDENGEFFRIEVTHTAEAKETRAEGTVGLYEQGHVTHLKSPTVFGDLSQLEKEQVTWIPRSRGGRMPSPNRIDALVWACRDIAGKVKYTASSASSSDIRNRMKRKTTVSADDLPNPSRTRPPNWEAPRKVVPLAEDKTPSVPQLPTPKSLRHQIKVIRR